MDINTKLDVFRDAAQKKTKFKVEVSKAHYDVYTDKENKQKLQISDDGGLVEMGLLTLTGPRTEEGVSEVAALFSLERLDDPQGLAGVLVGPCEEKLVEPSEATPTQHSPRGS